MNKYKESNCRSLIWTIQQQGYSWDGNDVHNKFNNLIRVPLRSSNRVATKAPTAPQTYLPGPACHAYRLPDAVPHQPCLLQTLPLVAVRKWPKKGLEGDHLLMFRNGHICWSLLSWFLSCNDQWLETRQLSKFDDHPTPRTRLDKWQIAHSCTWGNPVAVAQRLGLVTFADLKISWRIAHELCFFPGHLPLTIINHH